MDEENLTLVQIEVDAIKKNQELSREYGKVPLTKNGYMILKELNNHNPSSGLRIYSNVDAEKKYPFASSRSIIKNINLSVEDFEKEIKILFLKNLVDYRFNMNEKFTRIVKENYGLTEELLKYGSALDVSCSSNSGSGFRLTDRGLFAIIDYATKEMNDLENKLKNTRDELNNSIQKQENQLSEFKELSEKVDGDLKTINNNVSEIQGKVSKFNENIFTIFSLMIAAFAVIGINITSIPTIKGDFILNVLSINFSICFSLIVLFYLLKVLIHNEMRNGLGYLLIGFGLIFLIVAVAQSDIGFLLMELLEKWKSK